MIGLDTTFLIECDLRETKNHTKARAELKRFLQADELCVTGQILTEYVHVVTDPRRFAEPLDISEAIERSAYWGNAQEIRLVFPNEKTTDYFHDWMKDYRLGRKRVLDTMLAATYYSNGVTDLLTSNVRDFEIFEVFKLHKI